MANVIRPRLNETLDERGLSIADLVRRSDGRLKYHALRKLALGQTTGITFDTLDAICSSLNCPVSSVIEYLPAD